jgi:hypothetical protein
MTHWKRLTLALFWVLALPIVTGWSVAQASQPVAEFRAEPQSNLIVTHVGPTPGEPLMPGGSYLEYFAISADVDSSYSFALDLTPPERSPDSLVITIEDSLGLKLYDGPATGAAFGGRPLIAGQTDWISVRISLVDGAGLAPGAIVKQSWTVVAQPI